LLDAGLRKGQDMGTGTTTLEGLYEKVCGRQSDIYRHCPLIREYASRCRHVTEFGMRHGNATTAILAAQPERFVTYDVRWYPTYDDLKPLQGKTNFEFRNVSSLSEDIEETDLLFIDTEHTERQLSQELERHSSKVRRWIILHDTQVFAWLAPSPPHKRGTLGLLPALFAFLDNHPEWFVIYHSRENNGLTVISRDQQDIADRIESRDVFRPAPANQGTG
jgi:hypothetical protein